jgi:hypothetical protein
MRSILAAPQLHCWPSLGLCLGSIAAIQTEPKESVCGLLASDERLFRCCSSCCFFGLFDAAAMAILCDAAFNTGKHSFNEGDLSVSACGRNRNRYCYARAWLIINRGTASVSHRCTTYFPP